MTTVKELKTKVETLAEVQRDTLGAILDVTEATQFLKNGLSDLEVHAKDTAILALDNADRIDATIAEVKLMNAALGAVIDAWKAQNGRIEILEKEIKDLKGTIESLQ